MAKRVVLASLLLGAIVTGVSGWQRFPPTAENFEIGAFRSCDKATYIASGIIAEMDTVAHGAYSSGAAKSWVRAELSVSEFLLGDPTSDSTLTFVSFRYPGGFYPTTGERYIVFLEPSWDGMWQLVDGNFLTYLVGDSAQVAWPDTSLSLTGMRGLVDARLELRSPVWQDSAANLVLRGRILGPELRSCGTYDGPTYVVVDSVLKAETSAGVSPGDTVAVNRRLGPGTTPDLLVGSSMLLFLGESGPGKFELGPSLWSAWSEEEGTLSIRSQGCNEEPVALATMTMSSLVTMLLH